MFELNRRFLFHRILAGNIQSKYKFLQFTHDFLAKMTTLLDHLCTYFLLFGLAQSFCARVVSALWLCSYAADRRAGLILLQFWSLRGLKSNTTPIGCSINSKSNFTSCAFNNYDFLWGLNLPQKLKFELHCFKAFRGVKSTQDKNALLFSGIR